MWEEQKGEIEVGRRKDRDQKRREEMEWEKIGQKRMKEEEKKGEKGVHCPF